MSSSKRKPSSKSSRATTCSHTRKRAKSLRTKSGKRRKSHHVTTYDNFFAIKNIINEKLIDGKLHYQIDWADNPTTGESYLPTWEPAENANEDAVEDWEQEKQRRARPGLDSNLASEEGLSDEPTPVETPTGSIFVELLSKSDFLRSRPDFDTSQVIPISASQLSQFPHPGSQTELPPPQFCITSSHPSQEFIGNSQPGLSFVAESQDVTGKGTRVSQRTTIPDSQDFSTDLTQDSIPSRQPGIVLGSFKTLSFSTYRNPEGENPEEGNLEEGDPEEENPIREYPEGENPEPGELASSFDGFLTQLDFGPGDFGLSGNSTSQDADLPQNDQQLTTLAEETLLEDSQQPAQRVIPLTGQASIFQTQNEENFFSACEGYDIIPDSSKQKSRELPAHTSHCAAFSIWYFKPRVPAMEDSQAALPELSALDELRAIQAEFIPSYQSDAPASNTAELQHNEGPPTPVSPSSILNSVEQDTLESLHNLNPVQGQSVGGPPSWGQDSSALLFSDHLGPQQDASAMDSNVTSLTAPTPASGAIDHVSDMDMAMTANALNHNIEGVHGHSDAPVTITPSQLFTSMGFEAGPDTLQNQSGLSHHFNVAAALQEGHRDIAMQDSQDFGILPSEDTAFNEYVVTLPPAARIRAESLEFINSHRREIEEFSNSLSREAIRSPDSKAVIKIDNMLQHLTELSNLPPYHKDFPDLPQDELMRYARDTSSKMSFVYEFLKGLRDVSMEIVILATTGPVMKQLEAIVSQGGYVYRHISHEEWLRSPNGQGSACRVVLIDTSLQDPQHVSTANVVIAYDLTAEFSGLLDQYTTDSSEDQTPLVLSLVEVYTLEHINRRLSPAMDPFERKVAQVICLTHLSRLFEDEMAYDRVPQPHELAQELIQYLVDEEGIFSQPQVRWETWEHQTIPEDVFALYKRFRDQLGSSVNRKHRLEDDDHPGETPKRNRVQSQPEVSEELRKFLGRNIKLKGNSAEVSIEKLEDLVDQMKHLKNALDQKGEELKSWVKTVRQFQPKYKNAMKDRRDFEEERDKVLKEKEKTQKLLDASETKVSKLSDEKREIETKLQELTKSENPGTAAAAQREVDLKGSQEMVASLERQITYLKKDVDFTRSRYQDASDKAAALGEENAELRKRVADLETKASDNVVKLRQISVDTARKEAWRLYQDEKAQRLDRERELDKKNEELRAYKSRFSGRETRGSSVPRSPRVRQVSSRNTSPVADGGNGSGNGSGPMSSVFGPRSTHLKENF
ncbi:hypothetical protein VP1G_05232 [Cytospora mali]|uniref:Chromo domain-containing protein n=1 Tax=Cytospora mali TaxID=578113 RepID=A0A194V211_CYTMA|nr:hypothetical protein VP1G_05232 [Valsa mali var. pyri (nom. inval.)]